MHRRTLLASLAALPLAACAAAPLPPATDGPPITLVSAFRGRTTGRGHFRVWLTGDERRFTARLNGTVTGRDGARTLTVVEDFAYDDGQQDRLTWVFRETGPGRGKYRPDPLDRPQQAGDRGGQRCRLCGRARMGLPGSPPYRRPACFLRGNLPPLERRFG